MPPSPGPPRCTLTITQGRSLPAMYEMPSVLRLMPGEELDVITRTPAAAAPSTMLIAATSLSACKKTPPSLGIRLLM